MNFKHFLGDKLLDSKSNKQYVILTGQLRNFEVAVSYLADTKSFDKFNLSVSTWDSDIEDNIESVKRFRNLGGNVFFQAPKDFGSNTSVVAQHLSLSYGLRQIPKDAYVIRTRSDWLVEHNFMETLSRTNFSENQNVITCVGYIPSTPHFILDGHFGSSHKRMTEIATFDLNSLISYPVLHPEQHYFLPLPSERSRALELWLDRDLGTQFSERESNEWTEIRMQSNLYAFVLGEYVTWVDDNLCFFDRPDRNLEDPKSVTLQSMLFGHFLGAMSPITHLVMIQQNAGEQIRQAACESQMFKKYFEMGCSGVTLTDSELIKMASELDFLISKSLTLRNSKDAINHLRNVSSRPVDYSRLKDMQQEISWLRNRVKQLQKSTMI